MWTESKITSYSGSWLFVWRCVPVFLYFCASWIHRVFFPSYPYLIRICLFFTLILSFNNPVCWIVHIVFLFWTQKIFLEGFVGSTLRPDCSIQGFLHRFGWQPGDSERFLPRGDCEEQLVSDSLQRQHHLLRVKGQKLAFSFQAISVVCTPLCPPRAPIMDHTQVTWSLPPKQKTEKVKNRISTWPGSRPETVCVWPLIKRDTFESVAAWGHAPPGVRLMIRTCLGRETSLRCVTYLSDKCGHDGISGR